MDVFSTLMKKKLADKYVEPNNIVGTHKAPIEGGEVLGEAPGDAVGEATGEVFGEAPGEVIGEAPGGSEVQEVTDQGERAPTKNPIKRLKGKATLKPRVTCSACEFVGIEGKEMEMHIKKKHPTFDCNQCTYKCTLKIVLKRHKNSQHNHKCSSCEFSGSTKSALNIHTQAQHKNLGGLLENSIGFMIMNKEPNDEVDENVVDDEATEINTRKKKNKMRVSQKTSGGES